MRQVVARRAAADYERSLEVTPGLDSIPFDLADVYEKLDRPCDAATRLAQFLEFHPEVPNAESVRTRIGKLRGRGDCSSEEAPP